MNVKRWESVKDLLHRAIQLDPEQRARFLDEVCSSDASLRVEVESLLSAEEAVRSSFMQSPPLADSAIESIHLLEPGQIFAQRFQLMRKLGEGGMGQVWLAEQTSPLRRHVALKLIKAGMYDEAVVQRFQSERQSLAIMDHPAIAKVFDAGTTEQGQPYFVMEYVPGLPITEYCDQHKLSIKQRLESFIQACEAVQHAHQKAIIHRDLKPANILVVEIGGKPVPRIIDFGLAKAISSQAVGEKALTRFGGFVGTPGFMSPEQADPCLFDVDTRTDVYSLGVVLYMLLTGVLPLASRREEPLVEVLRQLREQEPERPSTKVGRERESASVAASRGVEPTQLSSLLRGDLDWIAMKALEKERTRRYGSPSDLAADIQRYLNHEPVVARPASAGYRLRKYVRRHRAGVLVAGLLVLFLAGFAVAQAVQLRRITLERDRANRERDRATRVTDFTTGMFKVSDPSQARGNTVTAREILDKASNDIDRELATDPQLQAQLMNVMGNVYENLGLPSRAQSLFERCVEIERKALGPENPETLSSMTLLSKSIREQGRFPEAEKLEEETLVTERKVLGAEDPRTVLTATQLAWTLKQEGRYAEAAKLDREALEIERRVLPPDSPQALSTINDLASALRSQGNYAEAQKLDRQTLETRQRVLGGDHPQTLDSMTHLASDLADEGLFADAEKVDQQAFGLSRRVYGPEHPYTLGEMTNLANDLESEGRFVEAEKLARQALEIQSRVLGPSHPQTVDAIDNLAEILRGEGRYSQAEKLDRQALDLRQRRIGPNHPHTLESMTGLASDLDAEGSHAAAENLQRKALDMQSRVLGPESPDTIVSMNGLAMILAHEGRLAQAEKLARQAQGLGSHVFGPQQPEPAALNFTLARIAALTGRRTDALALLRDALERGLSPDLALDMVKNRDLKSLQGDPEFDKIAADGKQRVAAMQKAK
jgi:eukaryotic-like serine/threonine-protein kinase